jgi:hypothetical protein
MAVVIGIIIVVTVLAWDLMRRGRFRADFDSTSAEIQSLIHQARQEALTYGNQVAVMVFPQYASGASSGRIVVVRDDSTNMFLDSTSTALTFATYDPSVLAAPANGTGGTVVTSLDLPVNVQVGPLTGSGEAALPFPYGSITVNVDCSFCGASGDRRGAIVFDGRGKSTFWNVVGANMQLDPASASGGSFTIYSTILPVGGTFSTSTFIITSPQGMVRTFHNG